MAKISSSVILLLILALAISGCKTVHKLFSSHKTHLDSTASVTLDSSHISITDSVGTSSTKIDDKQHKDSTYSSKVTERLLEFDFAIEGGSDSAAHDSTGRQVTSFIGTLPPFLGNKIIKARVKERITENNGVVNTDRQIILFDQDSSAMRQFESDVKKENADTHVESDIKDVQKTKEVEGGFPWLGLGGVCLILLLILIVFKWKDFSFFFVPILRRIFKKEPND
jgi:uncharacterized protein YceK